VFAFLKAFAERRAANVRTLDEVPRKLRLKALPDHPAIKIGSVTLKPGGARSRDTEDEEEARAAEPLIRVRRPTLTKAPAPPELVAEWVLRGWERPDGKVAVLELRNRRTRDGKIIEERFESDPARPRALQAWSRLWKQWSASEKPAREAMRVFETLYALHGAVEREGERVELVLGDGRLVWRTAEGPIDHPVLLQRVDLVFDPDVPEFRVVDSDRPPELNGPLLLAGGTLSGEKLNELRQELENGGFHPLASEETSTFLRRVVSRLGPAGVLKKDPRRGGRPRRAGDRARSLPAGARPLVGLRRGFRPRGRAPRGQRSPAGRPHPHRRRRAGAGQGQHQGSRYPALQAGQRRADRDRTRRSSATTRCWSRGRRGPARATPSPT
jgi:hypothetical protein